ncbi:MAG: hypothetical protein U5R48_00305 [Gammaproteobacteria bacterium]|nr:hypothetical protein [Gammaproteobacteria bacterium]
MPELLDRLLVSTLLVQEDPVVVADPRTAAIVADRHPEVLLGQLRLAFPLIDPAHQVVGLPGTTVDLQRPLQRQLGPAQVALSQITLGQIQVGLQPLRCRGDIACSSTGRTAPGAAAEQEQHHQQSAQRRPRQHSPRRLSALRRPLLARV